MDAPDTMNEMDNLNESLITPEEIQEVTTEPILEAKPEAPVAHDLTKQEICDRMKELIEQNVEQVKEEVESMKQLFYKKSKSEVGEQRAAYIEKGGVETEFIPEPTELETEFKELLNEFRNNKAKLNA